MATVTISKLDSLAIKVKHELFKKHKKDVPYKECLEIAEEILIKRQEDTPATDVLNVKPYKRLTKHQYEHVKYVQESIKPKRQDRLKPRLKSKK